MDDLRTSDEPASHKKRRVRHHNKIKVDAALQVDLSQEELENQKQQANALEDISADSSPIRRKKQTNPVETSNLFIQADLSNELLESQPDETVEQPAPAAKNETTQPKESSAEKTAPEIVKPVPSVVLIPPEDGVNDDEPKAAPPQANNKNEQKKFLGDPKSREVAFSQNDPSKIPDKHIDDKKRSESDFEGGLPPAHFSDYNDEDTVHSDEELIAIENMRVFRHVSSLVRLKTLAAAASERIKKDKKDELHAIDSNETTPGRVRFAKEPTYIEKSSDDSTDVEKTVQVLDPATEKRQSTFKPRLGSRYDPFGNYNDSPINSSDEEEKRRRKSRGYGSIGRRSNHSRRTGSSIFHTNLNAAIVFVYMIIPPDGGYGWFIVLTSFLCQVIVDGIIFSIGVLLPKISEEFDIKMGYIVVIGSVQIGCYFLSGTLASALVNAYGFRPVAIAGCLLAICAESIASFSNGLVMMLFFYSVMSAPGLSMIWVSSQLIIGYYFERLRPVANGLSVSGAGMGMFVFCFLSAMLLPLIGWRNVMRVHCAFLFVALLLSLSFLQVKPTRVGKIIVNEIESDSSFERASLYLDTYKYGNKGSIQIEIPSDDKIAVYNEDERRSRCCGCCRKKERETQNFLTSNEAPNVVIKTDPIDKDDLFFTGAPDYEKPSRRSTINADNLKGADLTRAKSVSYNINLINEHHKDSSDNSTEEVTQKPVKEKTKANAKPPVQCLPYKVRRAMKLLFDFKLLRVYEFKILLLSAFLFPMGLNIPFVYSKLRCEIDATSAALITPTIGISNLIFRIISGYIAFKYKFLTTFLCGFGIFFGGSVVFISAFYGADVVWFQFLYGFCYGVAPAFYSTLRAIIYVNSCGLDKLTTCFGLTALAMGLGAFIGTTTGGLLTELTGHYSPAFFFAGLCVMTSGLLKILLPFLIKRRRSKLKAANPV